MHIDIDQHSDIHSVIHRWDTRFKITAFAVIIISTSMVTSFGGMAPALLLSIMTLLFSRIPLSYILKKSMYPALFLIPLFIILPLTSGGEILFKKGIMKIYYDGLYLSALILTKTITIMTFFLIMMSTSPFFITAEALIAMGISEKLVHMILFTYRYLFVFRDDLRRMRTALRLRGFSDRSGLFSMKIHSSLIGSLLVKSYEQTDRVYHAMILRGYSGTSTKQHEFSSSIGDLFLTLLFLILSAAIIFADIHLAPGAISL